MQRDTWTKRQADILPKDILSCPVSYCYWKLDCLSMKQCCFIKECNSAVSR